MLSVRDLRVHFDGVLALRGVDLTVGEGEIVAVIGANGAGKSTLLRAIIGLLAYEGDVALDGRSIRGLPVPEVVSLGMSLVPESRQLFPAMTCRENLRTGLFLRGFDADFHQRAAAVFDLFPRLEERLPQPAGTLSGGEQQMLAIGRALMQDPRILLLDEPSIGLSPSLTREVFQKVREIRDHGRTVLLVEQKARLALEIADRAYVLSLGRITHHGAAKELLSDSTVQELYFGRAVGEAGLGPGGG